MNGVNSDKRGCDKMIIQTGMRTDIPGILFKMVFESDKRGICMREESL